MPFDVAQAISIAPAVVRSFQLAVVIPTCNAAKHWSALEAGIRLQGLSAKQIIIIDSASTDGTPELAKRAGFQVISIAREDFNHGGTRQAALTAVPSADIAVYLTQDAVLAAPDSIEKLIAPFQDPKVGATFGRQLPRAGAGPIETHARLFNYSETSVVRTWESRLEIGVKATFLSNSFAAYRISALQEVGGFPADVIMAEDAIVAARLLIAGWKTVYAAEATVYHSHDYTIAEEFRRYFDTGVYRSQAAWLAESFGDVGGEGMRFVKSELSYLFPRHIHLIPVACAHTFAKALGYRLGSMERKIPTSWKRKLSLNSLYWQ